MTVHRCCKCHYVPPHVISNLAHSSNSSIQEQARLSAIQSKASRSKRNNQIDPDKIVSAASNNTAPTETAKRIVFDCQNTQRQKLRKIRQEGDKKKSGDKSADLVFEYAGVVRDYFAELNRNSIDDHGMDIILNVHYGKHYMNAFWDGDEMTFGDGDGNLFVDFTKSLDVVAHELTHGITQHTANLDYYSQSGALNEHFSDVFGSAIQQRYNKQDAGNADWLVGNEIMGPDLFGESLRSMKAPGAAYDNTLMKRDPQPSHMRDYFSGPEDRQGVHINSGIPNRAFYLVATDIGTHKAALIWYHALQMLWPDANFNNAVEIISQAARLLTKQKKVPEGATQSVRLAFKEVGLPS